MGKYFIIPQFLCIYQFIILTYLIIFIIAKLEIINLGFVIKNWFLIVGLFV